MHLSLVGKCTCLRLQPMAEVDIPWDCTAAAKDHSPFSLKICNMLTSCFEFSISFVASLGSGFMPSMMMSPIHSYLLFGGWKRKWTMGGSFGWQHCVLGITCLPFSLQGDCFHMPPPSWPQPKPEASSWQIQPTSRTSKMGKKSARH